MDREEARLLIERQIEMLTATLFRIERTLVPLEQEAEDINRRIEALTTDLLGLK